MPLLACWVWCWISWRSLHKIWSSGIRCLPLHHASQFASWTYMMQIASEGEGGGCNRMFLARMEVKSSVLHSPPLHEDIKKETGSSLCNFASRSLPPPPKALHQFYIRNGLWDVPLSMSSD